MNDRSESSARHNLQRPAADQTEGRGHRWVTIRASVVGFDGRVKGGAKKDALFVNLSRPNKHSDLVLPVLVMPNLSFSLPTIILRIVWRN